MTELEFTTFAELAKFLEGKTIARVSGYDSKYGNIIIDSITTTDGYEVELWGRADECYFGGVISPEERKS